MSHRSIAPLLLLAALALACDPEPTAPPPIEQDTGTTVIPPFDLAAVTDGTHTLVPLEITASNHIAVEVSSQEGSWRFFVDTGASTTVLSEALAEVLDVQPGLYGLTSVEGLSVGTVAIATLTAVVFDLDDLNAGLVADGGRPIEGILGADVLAAHDAIIDYTAPAMYLASDPPPANLGRQLRDALADHGYAAVPLVLDGISFLRMDAAVDGAGPLHGLLDSGAAVTAVELAAAEALGLSLASVDDPAATASGTVGTYSTTVDAFALGTVELGPAELLVLDLGGINDTLQGAGLDPVEVLVGGDLLSARRAVVDYVGDRLHLLP